ncbi:MAG: hypothetical protein M3Y04_09540, partial [Actinomycetota bacterium]|nr:hypothetical protein [Actinomycetota bacterium]
HGALLTEFDGQGGPTGNLGYPTADTLTSSDHKSRYSNFEQGRIYYLGKAGTFAMVAPFFAKHEREGGVHGILGYPTSEVRTSRDRKSKYQNYENGRIYERGSSVVEIHDVVFDRHESLDGVYGPLGYPAGDLASVGDGRGQAQWFEGGLIWYSPQSKAHGLWGKILDRFAANGHVKGYLHYPTSEPTAVGDGRGLYATFERGRIYATDAIGGYEVHGALLTAYLDTYGGPKGQLGYPTSELAPRGSTGGRDQRFERGTLRFDKNGLVTLV